MRSDDGTAGAGLRVSGRLGCEPADIPLAEALLPEHIRLTRAEPGCLRFEVSPVPGMPGVWELDELFVDRAAFETHRARTAASDWGRRTAHFRRDFTLHDAP